MIWRLPWIHRVGVAYGGHHGFAAQMAYESLIPVNYLSVLFGGPILVPVMDGNYIVDMLAGRPWNED